MALSILYQATVYALAYIIHSRYNFRENLFYLYREERPASAFRMAIAIFTTALVFNLPIFASNYYFARECFKEKINRGEIVINILIMAACNILLMIIIFKIVMGEAFFDSLSFILAGIVIAATFFMEFMRYKIYARKAA
tara:strand:+ start:94 stop:510 length:417 start_codon:yes stop_codon:yes gene_type:complete